MKITAESPAPTATMWAGSPGPSWGSIRECWSKCRLSGGDYVGGVAGLGATLVNCHTLVTIDEGSAYLGAVAGDVDSGGAVSGNNLYQREPGRSGRHQLCREGGGGGF